MDLIGSKAQLSSLASGLLEEERALLERIAAMFPGAPISTLVWKRGAVSHALESHPIRTYRRCRALGAC